MTNLPATFEPNALAAQMEYAKAMAASDLLPRQYQGKPANLLWAISYGHTLGVAPLTAVQSIHVINGKPTASADLIAGLVRRAGHKLRVNGDDKRAVAQIIRVDDPDFTFEVVWTIERAQAAKLTSKDTWKNFPAAMLKARAITEVARAACSEILQGTIYTPEELGANVDADGVPIEAPVQQLRRVPTGEPDAWATREENEAAISPEQSCADAAGTTKNRAAVQEIYRQAHAGGLLGTTVRVGNDTQELGAYLIARGQELATKAAMNEAKAAFASGDPEPSDDMQVVDAVVVEEGQGGPAPYSLSDAHGASGSFIDVELPTDDHAAAVAAFRALAAENGISQADADQQAYTALGAPLADVSPKAIWDLLSQLTAA